MSRKIACRNAVSASPGGPADPSVPGYQIRIFRI